MAKKESKEKIVLERVYNVPLRKEWLKKPKYKRAKKAVSALYNFVSKHMKSDNVKIGKYANQELWKHGIKNPPHHIKVVCKKYEDGKVEVELEKLSPKALREIKVQEYKIKEAKKADERKVEDEKSAKETPQSNKKPKSKDDDVDELEKKVEEVKEKKQQEAKKVEKVELKEIKKDQFKTHQKKEPPIMKDTHMKTEQFIVKS